MGMFRKVGEEELVSLESALERYLPISSQMLNIVRLKQQGRIKLPTVVDLFLYDDGVDNPFIDPFILSFQHPNIHSLYCIVLRPPITPSVQMIDALDAFVDWDRIHIFSAIPQTFFDNHLKPLLQKNNKREGDWEDHPCDAFILDTNIAMTYPRDYEYMDVGESVEVRSLQEKNVDQVLQNYDWTLPHSKIHVELAIKNMSSCGIFVTAKDKNETALGSFAVLSPIGLLNILYTEIPFRRRGFGAKVLQSLGRKVAEMGIIPRAECEVWNEASRQVQLKAGFTFVDKITWTVFKPKNS